MPKPRKSQQINEERSAWAAFGPFRSPWVRTALFILICLGIWVTVNIESLHQLAQVHEERDQLLTTQRALEGELRDLRDQRQELAINTDAIERAVREEARMTRPGEVLVLIERVGSEDN